MAKNNPLIQGLWYENPVFVLLLGMCPTLGVTTTGVNGLGMGLATTAVLILSNLVISLLKDLIPEKVRIPAFIVIIASFVTATDLLLQAYFEDLYDALGLFIPLIVVNCIILGRAESFASKNSPLQSALDGIGMGLGFTMALTLLGITRELLGAGTFSLATLIGVEDPSLASLARLEEWPLAMKLFVNPPGAFIVLGFLLAGFNKLKGVSK
jgi:electron transport complex protein RnfE